MPIASQVSAWRLNNSRTRLRVIRPGAAIERVCGTVVVVIPFYLMRQIEIHR